SGEHLKFEPLHYFWRQTMWVAVSLPVLFGVSMLPLTMARRMSLIGAAVCIALMVFVPFVGVSVNGARRWVGFGFAQFQPSEFLKPFFVVTVA
ncbi:FtsW/RodA/SpoVE family cell cycle protein, partial [Pseudomonas viridiflava]|uniref:FtsW/RodA/SpoVE family cell cycle protein n=2 Tax=Pseudomonadota TaxID=1224 RepID=UPI0013D61E78